MCGKRDPEGRRNAIAQAAAALLLLEGPRRLTHRRIADYAKVPLGATTQYFSSIDDLRHAGYQIIAQQIDDDYDQMISAIQEKNGEVSAIASCVSDYLNDRESVRADVILYGAAAKDPKLTEFAESGLKRFEQALCAYMNEDQARAVSVFVDGLSIEAGIFDRTFSADFVLRALNALLQEEYSS